MKMHEAYYEALKFGALITEVTFRPYEYWYIDKETGALRSNMHNMNIEAVEVSLVNSDKWSIVKDELKKNFQLLEDEVPDWVIVSTGNKTTVYRDGVDITGSLTGITFEQKAKDIPKITTSHIVTNRPFVAPPGMMLFKNKP